jgi:hypothetical protein
MPKKMRKGTWRTDGDVLNQTDHILIDTRHRSNLAVRVFRGVNVDSDHRLIGSEIRSRIARSKLQKGA